MQQLPVRDRQNEPEDIIVVEHATKSFGSKIALKDMSFSVPSGQICGVLGPNGAGKTTLFRLLMGILKTSSGHLQIAGLEAFEVGISEKK